ncbi:DUF1501 domain-containing protein [Duganella sp. BJB488]|uniref:DUF1501 domain-containing protein n=1 Tax=unclassified Duganella TaxID=2636909 RepID=UPI000E346876|nr:MULTISPECIES: DUF1501 domain-containing protein [unclassified Duganella]NVD73466.1 DUF1501 domain-containing protein [Duganella sp. BJB1802]RFP21795.1 DUF1501 domain-containing protein [Duganella sp. BJB489]RFP23588.1 DUF1501 domain-containing protein [Duganella sp. BJB488]RFP38754.1 DUF1501 domain-containing protein [Duganella sp. BJB480]
MHPDISSRRHFLGKMLALAGGSTVPFTLNLAAMGNAAAAGATDYKAIVCLFLTGGNDHFNTLLATDSGSWNEYQRLRRTTDSGSIALPAAGAGGGVLPIVPNAPQAGRTFALHPSLRPLKELFDAGRVAVLANVGTLIQPTTLAQYKARSVATPPRLFSHNDQQAMWQSSQTEQTASAGWGGRLGDIMASANGNAAFTSISTAGNVLFLSGRTVRQYQLSGTSTPAINNLGGSLFGVTASANPLRQIVTADSADPFLKEHAAVTTRAINSQATLSGALAGIGAVADPLPYINPNTGVAGVNPLAVQLQTVARLIASRNALAIKRQVFYVSLGGFDTHDFQVRNQADLLARVAHAMAYFDGAMANLQGADLRKQVTLFTASDFGRTFTSNGDGTDHGWGSHHFIMGGAVKGKDIYGSMPVTGLGHDLDVGSGSLLPTTSVDQYGATLASWFGLSASQIADVFPNIGNFSIRNLGFMG